MRVRGRAEGAFSRYTPSNFVRMMMLHSFVMATSDIIIYNLLGNVTAAHVEYLARLNKTAANRVDVEVSGVAPHSRT